MLWINIFVTIKQYYEKNFLLTKRVNITPIFILVSVMDKFFLQKSLYHIAGSGQPTPESV